MSKMMKKMCAAALAAIAMCLTPLSAFAFLPSGYPAELSLDKGIYGDINIDQMISSRDIDVTRSYIGRSFRELAREGGIDFAMRMDIYRDQATICKIHEDFVKSKMGLTYQDPLSSPRLQRVFRVLTPDAPLNIAAPFNEGSDSSAYVREEDTTYFQYKEPTSYVYFKVDVRDKAAGQKLIVTSASAGSLDVMVYRPDASTASHRVVPQNGSTSVVLPQGFYYMSIRTSDLLVDSLSYTVELTDR